ncbi:MAG: hypothetical protein VX191_02455 [Candidatus Thermoplasmatota archaeon]|nr:hypothetical protein [Candidatus Thermoplasmatota archaeon]MEE3303726.1 hypothetical protein [Candidatus Thermoplasmatota archaeon]
MRQLLALLMVAMLAISVSGAGESGVNQSTSTEGTGISSMSYVEMVQENTEFDITVTLDDGHDIVKLEWVTQVCINTGICWPPEKTELVDSGDGNTFTGSIVVDDYATYANWRFDLTRNDDSTETVPESGFGWKVWSDCWYDNETWGGPSNDCQGEEDVGGLLPGFAAPAAAAGLAMAALMARRD